jgi:hypothetical protein
MILVLALAGLLVAIVAVVLLRSVVLSVVRGEESKVVPSPNERYEVVVYRGSAMVDPVWRIYIRERDDFWPKEWSVGCINGDVPRESFKWVRWDGAETLLVATRADTARVEVDVETGEPAESAETIWNC